ncbi:MAG TPA: TMEM175 family protein [Thermoleophilaceae bacterium]|nr:TMEM175 family protein [Thermoleophilaceae bacterium]
MEAFSDGVFAIAITLLVLEISVPESAFDDLWKGIADQWPSYLAYVTSFLTIGGLWIVHHGVLRRMRYADLTMLRLNLVLLMVVSFLPFPTKLVAEAISLTSAERPAVLFYGVTLATISAVFSAIVRHVAGRGDLVQEGILPELVEAAAERTRPNLHFYAVVLVLAVLALTVAAFGFLAIAVLALVPRRRRAGTTGEGLPVAHRENDSGR